MARKVSGCGNTVCKWNDVGSCKLSSVIIGANGNCLLSKADPLKAKEEADIEIAMQKVAAEARDAAEKLVRDEETQARRIGFNDD